MAEREEAREPRERPDRRAQILDAAREILDAEGAGAASVRAVARRAGLGASTVRYWFPTQESLAIALAADALRRQLRDERIADRGVDPAVRLAECLGQFLPERDEQRHELRGWLTLVVAAVDGGPGLGPGMFEAMQRAARERMTEWLEVLAAEGALDRAEIPRLLLAIETRIDGLSLHLLQRPGELDLPTARAILRADVEAALDRHRAR